MKKVVALATAALLVAGLSAGASARGGRGGGYGMMGYGPGGCWERRDWDDDGPANRRGWNRGPGPESCPNCPNAGEERRIGKAIEKADEAAERVASFIERTGNPNLKVGKVNEAGRDYEVEIVTKDGSLANKVYVEKDTGRIVPAYR